MTFSNLPGELDCETRDNNVRFRCGDVSTDWMESDDSFIKRVTVDNLNPVFLHEHILKEIEIKNILDDARDLLARERYSRAIDSFDEVLYYDSQYGEALIGKSHALYGQGHFVKSLRYYKRAVKSDSSFEDIDYYKLVLRKANEERSGFPKLKLNIYAGDEFLRKGEFEKAVESYDRALANPSKFKEKILNKLLNKKANALMRLELFGEALDCFLNSSGDYAMFGRGFCQYRLGLSVDDAFKSMLCIGKNDQLRQAMVLNDLGFFNQSLEIIDFLMINHYKCDDFYHKLLDLKLYAYNQLNKDCDELKSIINSLY